MSLLWLLPKGSDTGDDDDEGTQQDESDSSAIEVDSNESISDTDGKARQLTDAEKVDIIIDGIQLSGSGGGESATHAQGNSFTNNILSLIDVSSPLLCGCYVIECIIFQIKPCNLYPGGIKYR